MLFYDMNRIMTEQPTGLIPVIAPFLQKPSQGVMLVPQLSEIIGAKKEDLPNYFVIHP